MKLAIPFLGRAFHPDSTMPGVCSCCLGGRQRGVSEEIPLNPLTVWRRLEKLKESGESRDLWRNR